VLVEAIAGPVAYRGARAVQAVIEAIGDRRRTAVAVSESEIGA